MNHHPSTTLTRDAIEATLNSPGFRKMILYHRLAEDIEVLEDGDLLFDSLVARTTANTPDVDDEDLTRAILLQFASEVRTYTAPLDEELPDQFRGWSLDADLDSEPATPPADTDPAEQLRQYLEARFQETDVIEMKAKEIADELGLKSIHVGTILGKWRKSDTAPVAVAASETIGSSNVWRIEPLAESTSEE